MVGRTIPDKPSGINPAAVQFIHAWGAAKIWAAHYQRTFKPTDPCTDEFTFASPPVANTRPSSL